MTGLLISGPGVALLITIEAIELAIVASYKYKHRKDLLIPICFSLERMLTVPERNLSVF